MTTIRHSLHNIIHKVKEIALFKATSLLEGIILPEEYTMSTPGVVKYEFGQ